MASDSDEELARTATAPVGDPSVPVVTAAPIGATLGRYRLERELGAGGMGVVHAAFDPDLERRVALKVLRDVSREGSESHKRLLREARAMARLAHPNVVTVHEVGTADGRDYVAMELVVGETLADWLRGKQRTPDEITEAFIAAGRGLAAAHAAEIVHRDFKPHNVLRSREGRILVTDFGLAREAQPDVRHDPMAETMPLRAHAGSTTSTPSTLSGLTLTGSVLGTPAYMAPEQWSGGAVTPATDQFAFCVALWEALAGERPFRGPTAESLREEVGRGPAALDASKLPRKLRPILRRGLDPIPAKRWPSMEALLAALERATRKPGPLLAIGGAAVLAVGVIYIVFGGASRGAPACELPARDAAVVWSAEHAAKVRAQSPELAKVFDDATRDWQIRRTAACTAPVADRQLQLRCLDGVMARLAIVRDLAEHHPTLTTDDLVEATIDPAVCVGSEPPHLSLVPSPEVDAAVDLLARVALPDSKVPEAEAIALSERPNQDSCAHALALLGVVSTTTDRPRAHAAITDATSAAEQCADDALRAEVLLRAFQYEAELPLVGPRGEAAIKRTDVAVKRVPQADLIARLDLQRAMVAGQHDRWKEAFQLIEHAIAGFGARGLKRRQLGAVLGLNRRRSERSEVADIEAVRNTVREWKPIAEQLHDRDSVLAFERSDAAARLSLGDVEGAHAELARLADAHTGASPVVASRAIDGEVVDHDGKPVAGATVASAMVLVADSAGIGLAMNEWGTEQLRIVKSDAAGHFAIPNASTTGVVAAQFGDRRSRAEAIADHVKLVLEPTRRLSGNVSMGTVARTKLLVVVQPADAGSLSFQMMAPINSDGDFTLDGAPTVALKIGVALENRNFGSRIAFQNIPAAATPVTGIQLTVSTSERALDVLVRSTISTPLDNAQILILPGRQKIANVTQLVKFTKGVQSGFARPLVGEASGESKARIKSGDLVGHFTGVDAGDVTVCAIGLMGDLADPVERQKIQAHSREFEIHCEQIDGAAKSVVVQTPPQKRFD